MSSIAAEQSLTFAPPRRGAVFALTVDSTARPYNISTLILGSVYAPAAAMQKRHEVVILMQAETNDVYFHFASATANDLDNTAAIAAGGAVAFANTYGAVLKAGNMPIRVRIDRSIDQFLIVKAASTSGILRFWAASDQD